MAKTTLSSAENYVASDNKGSGLFFKLPDDGDTAVVRFMLNSVDDMDVHRIHDYTDEDGTYHSVECLCEDGGSAEDCPFCKAGLKPKVCAYVPMYNVETKQIQIWRRGFKFLKKIASFAAEFNPLVSTPMKIKRMGKKGDQTTEYEIFPQRTDNVTMEELPKFEQSLTSRFEEMSYQEMQSLVSKVAKHNNNNSTYTEPQPRQPQQPTTKFGNGGNQF